MARKGDRVKDDGDANHASDVPAEESTIGAIPYHPNLYRTLKSVGAAVLLTYLEIHHPNHTQPVRLEMDQVAQDLQCSRRTLLRTLSLVSTWYKDEAMRWRFRRAAREFVNEAHVHFGRIKPYSIVGPRTHGHPGIVLYLRRNPAVLDQLRARFSASLQTPGATATKATGANAEAMDRDLREAAVAIPALSIVAERKLLAALLVRNSALVGDRRGTRYERRRGAGVSVERRSKAVDPALPPEIQRRMRKAGRSVGIES